MTEESSQMKESKQDDIPATARAIKITNIQNPYIMRAYDIVQREKKINKIDAQLCAFTKKQTLSMKNNTEHLNVDDMVFIQSSNHKTGMAELPSYLCRGLITYIKKESGIYNVLLVDHGISIELNRDEIYKVPKDFIREEHLTKTVGIYNILPIYMRKNVANGYSSLNKCKTKAIIVEEWGEEAIQFAKNLLVASEAVYFDHIVTDKKNGREYGEFYLIIDDLIISLSEALVVNYYATYLEGDLLKLIESPSNAEDETNTEEDIIIHAKFSTNRPRNAGLAKQITKHCTIRHVEKILIQSSKNCRVLVDVTDLSLPKGVHKGWDEYINSTRPRKIQSYMWPAIKNGLNVVAIGSSQCGKTAGCVMAICGLVVMHQKMTSYNATHPLALILCSSSFEVINVHSLCSGFLQYYDNIKSVAAFNGKTHRLVSALIYNGCQILITTPRYLARFLNDNNNLLSFDKLSYLLFDNADIILDKYYKTIGELFQKHKIIENRDPECANRPMLQIILSATKWTSNIKKFVSLVMYDSFICIASFIEAVVFKSLRPKLYILKSIYKNQKILALREIWDTCIRGLYPVLICTDAILSQLNCTNIQWLIHHSVLLTFKNQFNYRFSVLLDNLAQDTTKCKVSIIIDEHNNLQFQSIMRIMQRMNVIIPSNMEENIERIALTLERSKKNHDICDNVKSLGLCPDESVCVFRHCILSDVDAPMTNIQINDTVKLMVLYIHDTTHFSARLIEHIPHLSNSKKIPFSNVEYMQITQKIQEYYQNIENRKICTSTNVGDICVLEGPIDAFKRVQIRRIRYDRDTSEEAKFVDVRCIDTGLVHECVDIRKLIHIPTELLNLPTHIVEIFIADVVPYDEEYTWNHYATDAVHKWFKENVDSRSYITGKVRLHLGNTIWLDDIVTGTKILNHKDLIGFSLKDSLEKENHAILNDNHMLHLLKLCKKSGLSKINGYHIDAVCK
ncbi:putative ATP-dependent RNA helicase TDRD12 isoform X2 [Harpegnathos saltator]|uniref:putative ATP-dependent RNA helicase TDRD12 isoform X2 n=1 Tax=Harpegnathos saltator TaxID=610380 RepID=UPI000948FDD0|nr:putative ATP-dependent RNA helicase TDRD12 isoform X2 [Harpegnathos saltator]